MKISLQKVGLPGAFVCKGLDDFENRALLGSKILALIYHTLIRVNVRPVPLWYPCVPKPNVSKQI